MNAIGHPLFPRFLPKGLNVLSVVLLIGLAGVCIAALTLVILLPTGYLPAGRQLNVIGLFAAAAALAVAYYIARCLADLFGSFSRNEPFEAANAGRLRGMAAAFALTEIIKLARTSAETMFVSTSPVTAAHGFQYHPNLMTWFTILLLLALAEVFREGARLRNEQNLTV